MSPYDSDNTAASNQADTELADAYEGADRMTRKYRFPLKVAAFYASIVAVGYVVHLTFDGPVVNTLAALMVYFTFLIAGLTVLLGVVFKLASMVRAD